MAPVLDSTLELYCYGCECSAESERAEVCGQCGGPLSLRSHAAPDASLFRTAPGDQWHYAPLLPIAAEEHRVRLGEGASPLLDAPRLGATYHLELVIKNEAGNPTGSFKDRQVAVGASRARELGHDTVAVVSSGNVACAAAAYAARAGLNAVVMTHAHAAPNKLLQTAAYGATVLRVQSPSARAVFDLCRESCRRLGWYHLSTAGIYEPYNVEGAKTIAYELFYQTGGDLPDWLVIPVGGGGLLGGIWRGLLDLRRLGFIERLPRLAGVQPTGCAPLVRAMDKGMTFMETLDHPWENPQTVAGGLADDILFDGHTALPALRSTDGAAIATNDDAIIAAEVELARTEGLLCEPSSAVAFAALPHLPLQDGARRVCCILTGTGIKDLDVLAGHTPEMIDVEPNLDALEAVFGANA